MNRVDSSALVRAAVAGTVLQLGMVIGGHYSAAISQLFPLLGVAFSFIAGGLYAWWAARPATRGSALLGGGVAGAVCAFLGIAVSVALGDVYPSVLAFGTASSAVTGVLGGLLGHRLAGSGRSIPAV